MTHPYPPRTMEAIPRPILPVRYLIGVTGCLVALGMGLAIGSDARWLWVFAAAAAGALSVLLPTDAWIFGALALAVCSRVFSAMGAPATINFIHFPLVGAAVVSALVQQGPAPRVARRLGWYILALGGVIVTSWIVNGGEFLRPVLTFALLAEPFLLVFACVRRPPNVPGTERDWIIIITLCMLQVPLGFWQLLRFGGGDPVQGTFMGQGTGAHVSGAVALLGALVCIAAVTRPSRRYSRVPLGLTAAVLLAIPFVADAKQVIVAYIPSAIILLLATGVSPIRFVAASIIAALVGWGGVYLNRDLRQLVDYQIVSSGLEAKLAGAEALAGALWRDPASIALGLGPGNSVSRVALMTSEGLANAGSPVASLELKTAPFTREFFWGTSANYMSANSSAWSGASSWLGILGDIGVVGLAVYLWICWILWTEASMGSGRSLARAALVGAALLGGVYSWLEEPGYMLPLAAILACTLRFERNAEPVAVGFRAGPSVASRQ